MKSENIVTLTMNPAIDVSSTVKQIMTDHKIRCLKNRTDPGGGGINVARAMKRFGADPLAIFPLGGSSGHMLEKLVAGEDVRHQCFNINRECRANFTVNEIEGHNQYRFVLPGPTMNEEEWNAGLGLMTQASMTGYAIASGSLPRGVPHDFYARLARNLKALGGGKMVLDTSGPPLKHALEEGVFLVKPSLSEFSGLLDTDKPDQKACVEAARTLVTNGKAEIVALTLGPDGAILVSRDIALQADALKVTVKGTVGAGDSFLAVLLLCIAKRQPLADAFRQAIAAGAAALMSAGTGLCSPEDVTELAPQVNINIVS